MLFRSSVNILGYPIEDDSIIKITDIKLANELLDIIYNNGEKKYENSRSKEKSTKKKKK